MSNSWFEESRGSRSFVTVNLARSRLQDLFAPLQPFQTIIFTSLVGQSTLRATISTATPHGAFAKYVERLCGLPLAICTPFASGMYHLFPIPLRRMFSTRTKSGPSEMGSQSGPAIRMRRVAKSLRTNNALLYGVDFFLFIDRLYDLIIFFT